jgi:hypothetical protein
MCRLLTILGSSLLLLFLSSFPANATQIIYKSPRKMGQESSLVVEGKVASVRSFWNGKRTKILTETAIAIDETFKGSAQRSVRILQLGGTIDNMKVTVQGAPDWKPGEEVLLFLEPYDSEYFRVSAFSQGKFSIERDSNTGEPFVYRPALQGTEVLHAPSGEKPTKGAGAARVPLQQFIADALDNNR